MKVCFITGTLGRGGAERQLLYMLRALRDTGIETRVLCLTRGEPYEATIEEIGIEVEWLGDSKSRIVRMLKIINNIRKRPVDILQSSHFYTNIYAGATGRLLGIPSLGAVRNDLTSELAANGIFGVLQLRLPGHLMANSKLALSRAKTLGISQQRAHFLGNVVEAENLNVRAQKAVHDSAHIVFVGRLVPQKNPELFVRFASRLVRDLPNRRLTFEVAGDGPLRGKLEHLVSESGFSAKQFDFSGMASNIDTVYRQADIVVLTSDHEGTPNVILESMARGIPVVATAVGGVPEILDHERGCLVEPRDVSGLVAAAAELISNPPLRRQLGENGRCFVRDYHSFTNLGNRLTNIYAKLMREDRANGNI